MIPALSRNEKTGALTVAISPLVALMSDQVAGLESRGITCCAAVNGLLSMPERADVLDRIRLPCGLINRRRRRYTFAVSARAVPNRETVRNCRPRNRAC